jgi:hypothetical protein
MNTLPAVFLQWIFEIALHLRGKPIDKDGDALAIELEWALHGMRGRKVEWSLVHLGRARGVRLGKFLRKER